MNRGQKDPKNASPNPAAGAWMQRSWPLALLCALAGSRWLLEGVWPETAASGMSEAAGCWIAAGLVGAAGFWRAAGSRRWGWRTAIGGGLLLAGPALGAVVAGHHVSGNNGTLALSLVPVVVAVSLSGSPGSEADGLSGRLWPGLAGLAGLLLLLPEPVFYDWRFTCGLVLIPLVTGVAGALTALAVDGSDEDARSDPRGRKDWKIAALLMTGFLLLGAGGGLVGTGFHLPAAVLDGVAALLSLEVLERMGAIGWGAQFLLVPLLTMLEGAALLRPVLDVRSWVGFLLLAISGGYLLLGSAADRPGWTKEMVRR
jgi:hypothetical protein